MPRTHKKAKGMDSHTAPARGFDRLIAGSWLDGVILMLAALALFATPLQMLRVATPLEHWITLSIAGAFALVCATLIWRYSNRLGPLCAATLNRSALIPIWLIAIIGLVLRIAWIVVFPAEPGSDGGVYLALGSRLSAGETYQAGGTYAYWPVGYPLFLSVWQTVLGDDQAAYLLSNLAIFLVGLGGIAHLGQILGGPATARIAAFLFAIWPNLVFSSATPEKEMLVLALLPWAVAFLISASRLNSGLGITLFAGCLMGAATLVQPSLQFLPLVGAIFLLGTSKFSLVSLMKCVILIAGAAAIVSPWTLRNYQHFNEFVLVATNGGDVLYRANNPLATGGYTPYGEIDLSSMDELERDRLGRRYATEWIKAHPIEFASLMAEKQIRFMGDDAVGVYTTLKVGKASDDGKTYALLKALSNAWWMLAWAALAALTVSARQQGIVLKAMSRTPIWLWLYLFAIHSVFESAGKYHVPILSVLCVLLAVFAGSIRPARHV